MARLCWMILAVVATAAAVEDEIIDLSLNPEFSIYVDRWSECDPKGLGEYAAHAAAVLRTKEEKSESLVYTPKLGLQQRQVQCRNHEGKFVEPINCETRISNISRARVCVLREDCLLGDWFPWRPQPDGSLVRNRRVIRLPQGGGRNCGLIEEIRPATIDESAHWSAGAWGPCKVATDTSISPLPVPDNDDDDADDNDAIYDDDDDDADDKDPEVQTSCGGGMQRREATCISSDGRTLHTTQCAHTPMPALVQPCEVPCPRDCAVGEWSEWGACQPTDGCPLFPVQQLTTTGYSVRRRRVISAASGGGAPCPPLEEKRTCSTPRCASWRALPWGPCVLNQPHTQCGQGKRTRELRCVGYDGKEAQRAWCSGAGAPARSERCRIACPGDCVVSAWTPWLDCSAKCAHHARPRPTRTRTRHILAHASPEGWPCPPDEELIQNETCNNHACATYSWLATPWGPCERKHQDFIPANNYTDLQEGEPFTESDDEEPCVEEGEMIRDVMCVQNNADVVREALCAPLKRPASRRACTVRCHRGCKVEAWMPWTPCPNSCEPAKQSRVRVVHGGPSCGPRQETRDCTLPASCGPRATTWITGEWSTCKLAPGLLCGVGYRVRSLWCGSSSNRVEAGTCVDQPVPHTVARCEVSCDVALPSPPDCKQICSQPPMYLDASDPDIPNCSCQEISLAILPTDSDCILPPGMECGEGRILRTAKCLYLSLIIPVEACRKFHPLSGPLRISVPSTDGYTYDEEFPDLLRGTCWVRCARDCAVGPWAPWGPCAPEPGTRAAFRFRSREVIQGGSAGGRECGATLQRATCNVAAPRWKVGEWSPCTPRHALCGHAVINRSVRCVDENDNVVEDSVCEASGAGPVPARDATCRAPCPADCVVSAWSDWSPCEQSRWGGRRDRTRAVLRGAAEGGVSCPQLVAAEPCDPLTYSWHVAPWDDCQPLGGSPCGEGTKKRSVRCLRSDGVFVNDSSCPNTTSTESESWCYVPCGVDCEVSEWSEWDKSACSCGKDAPLAHMRRTREQLTASVWPGRSCPPTEQRIPCPRRPCLRLISQSTMMCHLDADPQEYRFGPPPILCGVGTKMHVSRCEISRAENSRYSEEPIISLEPWRCTNHLPGRIVMPPLPSQLSEESCMVLCPCVMVGDVRAGPWGEWGPCHRGSRSRSRQLRTPAKGTCPLPSKVVTIEWTNCTEDDKKQDVAKLDFALKDMKQRERAHDKEIFHNGFVEGSKSLLIVIWAATFVLILYGCYAIYVFTIKVIRSRRLKSITKV